MLLASLDLGNSRLHAALFAPTPTGVALVETRHDPDFRKWRVPVAEVAYASVRPEGDRALERAVRAAWNVAPARMGRDFPAAIRNRTRRPKQVGADRLANAVAAWRRHRKACVVVDLGTAITVDIVNGKGEFVGGAIAPGISTMARALHDGTSRLPEVPARPRAALGRDTREAIQAGLYAAARGVIGVGRHLIAGPARLIGTGGDACWFEPLFDEVVPHLTLEGIALSWLASQKRLR